MTLWNVLKGRVGAVRASGHRVCKGSPQRRAFHALALLALTALPTPSVARCADLALVLAIDASGSIGEAEFKIQLQGYAAAFRSHDVQQAIRSVGDVDVAVVLWADGEMAAQVQPFRDVSSVAAALDLADRILRIQRTVTGNTGIGRGLWTALDLIEYDRPCAHRRVVNVSGDGKESKAPRSRSQVTLAAARARAELLDVTVNALAIQSEIKDLADWYSKHLLTGSGAFVMGIADLSSFAESIERKLVREIAHPMLAGTEVGDFPPRAPNLGSSRH